MTDVQLNYINDGNKYFHLHKPSHSTKQKPISAKTLYIVTLHNSGLSEAQICDLGEWAIASHGKGTRPCRKVADVDINKCHLLVLHLN